MSEPALLFENVGYAYEETPREAVSDINIRIEAGEWVGVTGPTNAGKSTLCLLAMGLAPHFFGGRLRGNVTVLGTESRGIKVIERSTDVGLLFQNPFTQISGARERVDEEVAFGPECHGVPPAETEQRVEEAMRVGVPTARPFCAAISRPTATIRLRSAGIAGFRGATRSIRSSWA